MRYKFGVRSWTSAHHWLTLPIVGIYGELPSFEFSQFYRCLFPNGHRNKPTSERMWMGIYCPDVLRKIGVLA